MSNHLVKKKPKKEDNFGVKFYLSAGKVFLACGIVFFFLTKIITTMPQDYKKYNVFLWFVVCYIISAILMLLGITLLCLCKKSKRFQAWADKDMEKALHQMIVRELQKDEKKRKKTEKGLSKKSNQKEGEM